ncbi:MAG: tetratricopeptide repeat protein [Crocinitomicaceae bacterium]
MKVVVTILIGGLFLLMACKGDNESTPPQMNQTDSITQVTDSLDYYQKKLNADPTNPEVKIQRALYYLRHNNVELATQDLEEVLAADSLNLKAHQAYADLNLGTLNLEKSKYHYEYILKLDSTQSNAYLGLARIYAALDNFGKADAYISGAIKQNPYSPDPYFVRGLIYRSDYYMTGREKSWDIAKSSFQTATEQNPDYYSAYIELGVMHAEKGDSIALEYYNSALDVYPESIEAWYNKGMFYQDRRQVDKALNCYYTINQIDSSWSDAYHNIGFIHLIMTEELDSAVHYFSIATDLDPNFYQAYNNLGLAYEKQGDLENAKKYYQKAIAINPDFQLAKDNLNALQ